MSGSDSHVRRRVRVETNARDLEKLNCDAERLNAEAAEVLEYQASSGW
ncbi:MAG: hypothetical protein H0X65_16845 [Gemmatimonadetes bacterium]|nr:hypothetical protein [Gemmatimonadota bacterium]